jgi:glycosyltransferase involved in cell wall biosynthesis
MKKTRGKKTFHLGVNTLFYVPGDVGGTETYLKEVLLAIVQQFPQLPITLFTNADNDFLLREKFSNYSTVTYELLNFRASIRPLRILMEQIWLPLKVVRSNVSILWSPGYTAPLWSGCPQVVTIHDLQYKSYPEDMSLLERTTLDILVRLACRVGTAIISVSQFAKSELVKYRFVEPAKVFPILEGVDPSFSERPSDMNPNIEIGGFTPTAKKYILCVAHTYPHKNVHLLVDAFRKVHDKIPHDLVLVGKARRGERVLQESLARVNLPHRIHRFQNGVSISSLKLLYQNADIFVLPSFYEGFGLPVLEAMMAGVPVIIPRKASLPEVGGHCASYPEPFTEDQLAEKVLELAGLEEHVRSEIVEKAQDWVAGFSWKNTAQETVDLFRMVHEQSAR